jgi:2-polyprenyl-6-methoxyphenol hydroxylase-like FAD-dependent oxidoreductase
MKGMDNFMATNQFDTDVLVVGAGPVGLTLALDLARRDISCRIIDQAPVYPIGTRGRGINARTQEVFEALDVLKPLFAYAEPNRIWRIYGPGNQLVREFNPASLVPMPTPDKPYLAPLMVSQQHTEAVLREHLASLGVHVEMNTRLLDLTQHEQGVVARAQVCEAVSTKIRARYLVGCDGGHSTVRHCANIAFQGEAWQEEQILANVTVSGLDPDYWCSWSHPDKGTVTLNYMSQSHTWFFIAPLSPDEHGSYPAPTLETLQRLFDERASIASVRLSDPTWISIWRPNIRMVERYRDSRVFLAGDAAHVHSAAGGQGLNTGVQDAYNLGWKLAAVLSGAPDTLLDTYQAERLPIAAGVLASTSIRHRELNRSFSGQGQGLTNLLSGKETFADPTQLSLNYRGSELSRDEGSTTSIRAGDRAPDAPCIEASSGKAIRLFDVFRGPHFTLLTFSDRPATLLPDAYNDCVQVYRLARPDSTTTTTDKHTLIDNMGHAHQAYGITNDAVILIRPDGYIGLIGGNLRLESIVDYLCQVTGR